MKTAKLFKELRARRKLSQLQVAERMKAQPQFVSLIEAGRSKLPAKQLDTVCEIFKCRKTRFIKAMVEDYEAELRCKK